MASTLPRPRKRSLWSPGTEQQLWARIRERDDRPISAVIRDFCREKGLSFHTARAKYYRQMRAGGEPAGPAPADTVLEDIGAFLRDAGQVPGVELDAFLGGLKTMAAMAAAGRRLPQLETEVDVLRRERDELTGRLDEYRRRLETLAGEHRTLDFLVGEFTNLTSVGKVASLGDFARKLKYQVDQFGQVIKVQPL